METNCSSLQVGRIWADKTLLAIDTESNGDPVKRWQESVADRCGGSGRRAYPDYCTRGGQGLDRRFAIERLCS
jgi:hypothetical protein